MKPIARITDENGDVITISYDGNQLFAEWYREPIAIGANLATEQEAIDYIFASYGSGWQLGWIGDGRPRREVSA